VLSQGQGSFFAAAPLKTARGRVGTVFGYRGWPVQGPGRDPRWALPSPRRGGAWRRQGNLGRTAPRRPLSGRRAPVRGLGRPTVGL